MEAERLARMVPTFHKQVRPTDQRAVRAVSVMLFLAFAAIIYLMHMLLNAFCFMGGGSTLHHLRHHTHLNSCFAANFTLGSAIVLLVLSAPLCFGLSVLIAPSQNIDEASSNRFILALCGRVTTRECLHHARQLIGCWLLALELAQLYIAVSLWSWELNDGAETGVLFGAVVVALALAALLVVCPGPRHVIEERLAMWGCYDETSTPAALSILIGCSFRVALADARPRFRGIWLLDLLGSSDGLTLLGEPTEASPFPLSQPAALGEVDAFLSHSSQDLTDDILKALKYWQEDFRATTGRDALVWMDTACLNQQDIRGDVARLPLFIAGCRQLVLLIGSTFCTRFWCIMELVAFMETGGQLKDVKVLPVCELACSFLFWDRTAPPPGSKYSFEKKQHILPIHAKRSDREPTTCWRRPPATAPLFGFYWQKIVF